MDIRIHPIGIIENENDAARIVLHERYRQGLRGLQGFGHVQIIWWFDQCDNAANRANLVDQKPYVNGPDELGVFATRSPKRPNPVALSCAGITYVDEAAGVVGLEYSDAFPGLPARNKEAPACRSTSKKEYKEFYLPMNRPEIVMVPPLGGFWWQDRNVLEGRAPCGASGWYTQCKYPRVFMKRTVQKCMNLVKMCIAGGNARRNEKRRT